MIRIAGIDGELTPLDILWIQADESERLQLVCKFLANKTNEVGGMKLTVTLNDDSVVIINTKKKRK